jgi:hypothetical protein
VKELTIEEQELQYTLKIADMFPQLWRKCDGGRQLVCNPINSGMLVLPGCPGDRCLKCGGDGWLPPTREKMLEWLIQHPRFHSIRRTTTGYYQAHWDNSYSSRESPLLTLEEAMLTSQQEIARHLPPGGN